VPDEADRGVEARSGATDGTDPRPAWRRQASTLLRSLRLRLARAALRQVRGPFSLEYGFDRGTPLDRPYIEAFLERHRLDVHGRVLEVKDSAYTLRFGAGRVRRSDVVDVDPTNPLATIVADLDHAGALPESCYDCILLTQVLEFLRPELALPTLYRSLVPGGVLLVSVPVLTRLESPDDDYQRWSAPGLRRLLADVLPGAEVEVSAAGDVTAVVGLALGLSVEDAGRRVPAEDDWRFPVVVLARVRRPE
jgi:SAM-dependent methyltransferase